MIGGKVYAVNSWIGNKIVVTLRGTGSEENDFREINLEKTKEALAIKPGDSLWWQGRYAYWSPAGSNLTDIRIPRLGYSTAVPTEATK